MDLLSLLCFAACLITLQSGVGGIGINYGFLGDNLPPPHQVIALLKSRNVQQIRIFDPKEDVLTALQGSGIEVIVGVVNGDLEKLASDPPSAAEWVNTHIIPHAANGVKFRYIAAGNELIPGPLASHVLRAMQNLDTAMVASGIHAPVTTAVSSAILGKSYPPSAGSLASAATDIMVPIIQFLQDKKFPLLVNVYPYFAYTSDPTSIPLNYALFNGKDGAVVDGNLKYNSLFDAQVDAVYSAIEKAGGPDVEVVVSETGWPSGGEGSATIKNAQVYMNNLVSHVASGTPKKPGKMLETYIFALFNENLKLAGVEQNFGLYHPNMTEVYHVKL